MSGQTDCRKCTQPVVVCSQIDEQTMDSILRRARELADHAPPLTSAQIVRLQSIFADRAGGEAA